MNKRRPWTLTEQLAELERTDPAVKAAKERLDEVTSPYQIWRREMVRKVWGDHG